jgi:RNA polymerase sigma-70 factor (ECF subfamily)
MVGVSAEDRYRAWIVGAQTTNALAMAGRDVVAPLLDEILAAGRGAHPTLGIDELAFVTHLGRIVSGQGLDWAEALRRLHAADLWLAFACAQRIEGAFDRFEQHCHAVADLALRRMGISAGLIQDVKQQLSEKLLANGSAQGSRFLAYAGRGPLTAWVTISLQRIAQSFRRGESSARMRHQAVARAGQSDAVSPEILLFKHQYRADFSQAFAAAFAGLSHRERTVLRLHLLGRLRLDQIAPMFQVDPSTISRWMATARADVLAQTRRFLANRLPVSSQEFQSIARLLRSQIDISLSTLLQDDPLPA